eukprot:1150599-Pelagomonas_calceolata.AAC.1
MHVQQEVTSSARTIQAVIVLCAQQASSCALAVLVRQAVLSLCTRGVQRHTRLLLVDCCNVALSVRVRRYATVEHQAGVMLLK